MTSTTLVHPRRRVEWNHLWHACLVHMVQKDDRHQVGVLREIRTIATLLLTQTGVVRDYVDGLCKLSVPHVWTIRIRPLGIEALDWENDVRRMYLLLVAATYFGHFDLVRSLLLREGFDPIWESDLFGFPIQVAAQHGRNEILELMLYTIVNENRLNQRILAIRGASEGGHLDTLELILESRWGPGTNDQRIANALIESLGATRHVEIFTRIEKLTSSNGRLNPSIDLKALLITAAWNGHLEISRHILSKRAFRLRILVKHECVKAAVRAAARRGHSEIVELLFHRTKHFIPKDERLLAIAAYGGQLRTVQKLINLGFDVNSGKAARGYLPIVSAIVLEHEPMYRLLRHHGAVLDTLHSGGFALSGCYRHGLESMMALLLRDGVDITSELLSNQNNNPNQIAKFQEMVARVKQTAGIQNVTAQRRRHRRQISNFFCFG